MYTINIIYSVSKILMKLMISLQIKKEIKQSRIDTTSKVCFLFKLKYSKKSKNRITFSVYFKIIDAYKCLASLLYSLIQLHENLT